MAYLVSDMNKSEAMGLVLLLLGLSLALTVGIYSSSILVLGVGFVCVTLLFYMGIGLYSRGKTVAGVLRDSDEDDRDRAMYRTTAYISALVSLGALVGFGLATLQNSSIFVKALFGLIFLYNLPVSVSMWRTSSRLSSEKADVDYEGN